MKKFLFIIIAFTVIAGTTLGERANADTRTILVPGCSIIVDDYALGEETRYREDQLASWEELFGIDRDDWTGWGGDDFSMSSDLPYGRLMNAIWILLEASRNDSCNLGPACYLLTSGFDFAADRIDTSIPVCEITEAPGALAANDDGDITFTINFFYNAKTNQVVRAGALIHEARHSDGPVHVECTDGPYEGTPGCDQRFEDAGAWAIEVMYHTLLYMFDTRLSIYERYHARNAANRILADFFNETPDWRIEWRSSDCPLTFFEMDKDQFNICHDYWTGVLDGLTHREPVDTTEWNGVNNYDLVLLSTTKPEGDKILFSGRFKERDGYNVGELMYSVNTNSSLVLQYDSLCDEAYATQEERRKCQIFKYRPYEDGLHSNDYQIKKTMTQSDLIRWNDQMVRDSFQLVDISPANDVALEGNSRFTGVWQRNAQTEFQIDITPAALEDLLDGIGEAPKPILDFETYSEFSNRPSAPRRLFAVLWDKNNTDLKSHLEYDLTHETLQWRDEQLAMGGWKLARMESYHLIGSDEILYAGIWHKSIPPRDQPKPKLNLLNQPKNK